MISLFQYFYEIKMNGSLIYSTVNTDPKSFDDVRVYAADPWYTPVDGEIKNLEIFKRCSSYTGHDIFFFSLQRN